MSCGLKSEWLNKPINLSATPMEILALQWKITPHSCGLLSEWHDKLIISSVTPMEILALQWKASNDSDGKTKALRWEITPHMSGAAMQIQKLHVLAVQSGVWWDSV